MFAWRFNSDKITQYKRFFPLALLLVMLVLLPKSDANVRLCGAKLTATLKFVCKNQVCGGHIFKIEKQKRAYINDEGQISYLRHVPTSNNEALRRFTRSSYPGIVNECCNKKCSLDYLKTYCCLNRHIQPHPITTTTESSIIEADEYADLD